MKCIDYNTKCIGADTQSNQMATNAFHIAANTLPENILDIDNIVEQQTNVVNS